MQIDWQQTTDQTVSLLQTLISMDTTNPPGNELQAIEYLAHLAEENGLHCTIQKTDVQRANVMISYNGTFNSPLILLSHVDVVGANPPDWQVHPFSGEILDQEIWGRGALDCKQLITMELMSLILLKKKNVQIDRDIVLIVTADEEAGSAYGIVRLLHEYSHLFEGSSVISEGGGFPIRVGEKLYYLCETGQKGNCQIKFTVEKEQGTNPYLLNHRGLNESAHFIQRLTNTAWDVEPPLTTVYLFDTLLKGCGYTRLEMLDIREKLTLLGQEVSGPLFNIFKAMTRNTFTPTVWKGGKGNQALSGQIESEFYVDCRVLPQTTLPDIEQKLNELTKGLPLSWEILSFHPGYESHFETDLFSILNQNIKQEFPESEVVPFITIGSSDGRYLAPLNARIFGFSPVLPDLTFDRVLPLVHGVNERISIDSLMFGTRILYETIYAYASAKREDET